MVRHNSPSRFKLKWVGGSTDVVHLHIKFKKEQAMIGRVWSGEDSPEAV